MADMSVPEVFLRVLVGGEAWLAVSGDVITYADEVVGASQ
jgi:hypothetical protein